MDEKMPRCEAGHFFWVGSRFAGIADESAPTESIADLWAIAIRDHAAYATNIIATEFMQYRNPVGSGPSSNTWPRCASHRAHFTSVRSSIMLRSVACAMFRFEIG
jgi:hypothetical protein